MELERQYDQNFDESDHDDDVGELVKVCLGLNMNFFAVLAFELFRFGQIYLILHCFVNFL